MLRTFVYIASDSDFCALGLVDAKKRCGMMTGAKR